MKVVSKQNNSKMCIICGMHNDLGVKASFYNMEDGSCGGLFTFKPEHQSYPGRVHGGMLATMLDELCGRLYWVEHPYSIGVTMDINIRYHKPVPYDAPLKGRATYLSKTTRGYEAKAVIMDTSGTVLCEGVAKYLVMPNEKITSADVHEETSIFIPDDVKEIDF